MTGSRREARGARIQSDGRVRLGESAGRGWIDRRDEPRWTGHDRCCAGQRTGVFDRRPSVKILQCFSGNRRQMKLMNSPGDYYALREFYSVCQSTATVTASQGFGTIIGGRRAICSLFSGERGESSARPSERVGDESGVPSLTRR